MFRLWALETVSRSSEKSDSRNRKGSQGVYKFAGSLTSKIRYQIKEINILYKGRRKPLGSLNSFLSYAPQLSGANPVFLLTLRSDRWLFLHSPASAITVLSGVPAGSPFWGTLFTFGGQKLLMALTFFVNWYGRRYFHFTLVISQLCHLCFNRMDPSRQMLCWVLIVTLGSQHGLIMWWLTAGKVSKGMINFSCSG